MSRKKNKRQKALWDLIETVVKFGMFGAGLLVYISTENIIAALVAIGCVLGLFLGILAYRKRKRDERLKRSGIHEIDQMDGIQFEHYLSHVFQAQGYSVEITRAAGDYGADLILRKDGARIVVQAKRHSKNVGLKAVQEVQAAIAHYQASEGWVVSNREYTDEAYALARSNKVRLINREQLVELVLKLNPDAAPQASEVLQAHPTEDKTCSRCGSPMVLRKGPKGEFYGCSSYPKCRNTLAKDKPHADI